MKKLRTVAVLCMLIGSVDIVSAVLVSRTHLKQGDRSVFLFGCDEVYDEVHFESLEKFLSDHWLDGRFGFGQLFLDEVYDDRGFIDKTRKLHLKSVGKRNPYWNIRRLFMLYKDLRLERLQDDIEGFIGGLPKHIKETVLFTNEGYSDSVVEIFKMRGFCVEKGQKKILGQSDDKSNKG